MYENVQRQQSELENHERATLGLPFEKMAWPFSSTVELLGIAEAAREKLLNRSQEITALAAGGLRAGEVRAYWQKMGIIRKVVEQLGPHLPSPVAEVESYIRKPSD